MTNQVRPVSSSICLVELLDALKEELISYFGPTFIPNLFIELLNSITNSKVVTSTEVCCFQ